ncbi:MAG: DMT family transporter [Immundisolibacteraceae bacterium]|nr:DMT family transporter [Immundisolibacteraceae bacterium]
MSQPGNSPMNPRAALLLLGAIILLWGVNWPIMKVGLNGIGPFSFAASRMVLGGLTMFLAAALTGQLAWPHRQDWPVVISVGLIQIAAFIAMVTYALQFVPAGRSSILAYTTPLWVLPISMLLLKESVGKWKMAGFLLGLAGVLVMFNPTSFDWHDPNVVLGNSILMLAAMLWAILITQIRGHRWHGTPLSLAPWQFAVATLALLPVAFYLEGDQPIKWSTELWAVILYNGPIATGFCTWAIVTVTRALPALTTSLGTLGVPVTGVIASAIVLNEPITGSNLGGLLLIVGGLGVLAISERLNSTKTG